MSDNAFKQLKSFRTGKGADGQPTDLAKEIAKGALTRKLNKKSEDFRKSNRTMKDKSGNYVGQRTAAHPKGEGI